MSKILIVGDSNGLGEWGTLIPGPACANPDNPEIFRPYNDELYIGLTKIIPVWPGFGYYLDLKGHATVNYSMGGGSNSESLYKVEEALGLAPPFTSPVFYNPDFIIWVVTEPLRCLRPKSWLENSNADRLKDLDKYYIQRDKIVAEATSIDDINSQLVTMCLDNAQKIYNETKVPWIIIEGWGKLPQDLTHYSFIKHVHRNWIDKILGHEIPLISSMSTAELLRHQRPDLLGTTRNKSFTNGSEFIQYFKNRPQTYFKSIVDAYERNIIAMQESVHFPDNSHPDRHMHEALAQELEQYV